LPAKSKGLSKEKKRTPPPIKRGEGGKVLDAFRLEKKKGEKETNGPLLHWERKREGSERCFGRKMRIFRQKKGKPKNLRSCDRRERPSCDRRKKKGKAGILFKRKKKNEEAPFPGGRRPLFLPRKVPRPRIVGKA